MHDLQFIRIIAKIDNIIASLTVAYYRRDTLLRTQLHWRRNEINITGARRGPKGRSLKPEGLSRGGVLGEVSPSLLLPPSHQL